MNTSRKSVKNGMKSANAVPDFLRCAKQQAGRKLTPLEEAIIRALHRNCANHIPPMQAGHKDNTTPTGDPALQEKIIELTEDYACSFRIEPLHAGAASEMPKNAANAWGKLYRGIAAFGGQPLASLLAFSSGLNANNPALQHAVGEMALYTNTFGVPVAGGDIHFNAAGSPEFSASLLAIGLIDRNEQLSPECQGCENPVFLVGMPDSGGIQPQEDAFTARKLYELVCDLHEEGALIAVRSIENAGIAGACAEMIACGTNGMMLDINTETFSKIEDLTEPTNGQIIIILHKDGVESLKKACDKWNVPATKLGIVTGSRDLRISMGKIASAGLTVQTLSASYSAFRENTNKTTPAKTPANNPPSAEIPPMDDYRETASSLLTSPNLASQQWLFEQFDSTSGASNLSTNFVSDSAVLLIKGTHHALAAAFCQNAANVAANPESALLTAADALRRVACSGGIPRALAAAINADSNLSNTTLCTINKNIDAYCQKAGISSQGIVVNRATTGSGQAIHQFSAGAIAFLSDTRQQMTMSFKAKGDMIYMIGKSGSNLNASEYLRHCHNLTETQPQLLDAEFDLALLRTIQKLIVRRLVKSAHNVARGGLFMALLESAMVRGFGFDITADDELPRHVFLFGESPSRIIVSVATAREADFIDFMMETHVPFITLGHVAAEEIRIDDNSYGFISDYQKNHVRQ